MTTIQKWGVYNKGNELVSSRDGVTETQARQMADRWNEITNTVWYTPKQFSSQD